ncbi:MAG: T9SS type A sorting domain-containing protein [Bacteroidetes bacterium]|nr:T9SS type A sorting domain-containing protein [Bacteroidota bacterium]
MKKFFGLSILLSLTASSFAQLTTWQSFTDSIPTLSSPRACDLNNDGVRDIVIGGGTDGFASNNGIMAFNGVNGALLWKRGSRNEVFGSAIFTDITNDGIKDVFISGRQAQLLAINGANGSLLWDYFPYQVNPADSGLYNFYNPQFVDDITGDGIPDLLVANGGDHAAPDWETDRPPGHLMLINSLNGHLLAKAVVPDSAETYCSPLVADIQGDGTMWILYGTGGENLGGSFWACPLNDLLLDNSLGNSIAVDTDPSKGFIAPAALCHSTNGGYDIVLQSFGGKIKKISGSSFSTLWQFQLPNTESSAEPVLGNFTGGDMIPDVLAILFKGIAPSYSDFYQVMIDGSNGQMAFKDSLGTFNYASANALDFDNNGRDEGLVSVTYMENGAYKHRLQKIDFANGIVSQLGATKTGVNLGSTPLISDLDADNQIDLVYAVKKDSTNPVGWKGIYVNRQELTVVKPNSGIAWGSYLGTSNDGIYTLESVDCGFGSVITNATVTPISCNGLSNGSISLTVNPAAGPHTYLWTSGGLNSTEDNLSAGTYSVMVTNSLGCYEIQTFNLTDPFLIAFGGINPPTCLGDTNGTAVVNSSGCPCMFNTCTFLWDNGITTKPNNSLTSGWHTVIISHPGGCVVTDSVFVPEPLPVIIATNIVNNLCYGNSLGSIELINSNYPPYVYNWSTGDNTEIADSLTVGNYSVIASDARGCTDSLEFSISEPAELVVSAVVTDALCNGDATGEIYIQGEGGTENYTYWINQQNVSANNTNLFAGTYTIYISDQNDCISQSISALINEPQPLSATLTSTPQIIGNDGTASVSVSGGTAPYTYLWEGIEQTDSLIVYLNTGWYSVIVTDANDCQLVDSIFVDFGAGIENLTQNDLIYPNPVKNILSIMGVGKFTQLYDLNGRILRQSILTNSIDMSSLPSGTYIVEVEVGNNVIKRERFIKID